MLRPCILRRKRDDGYFGRRYCRTGLAHNGNRERLRQYYARRRKTDILICVHKKDAAFYYDSPSQMLFGSAEYPIAVNDPFKAYRSTDFSDLNDDGNSDVRMTFEIGGDITVFAWLWDDKNDTFVFSEALSDSGTAEKQ